MEVEIVEFPATKVALIEHREAAQREYETVGKLVAWKLEHRLLDPARHRHYGLHYSDPRTTPPAEYRSDFCLSVAKDVGPNSYGIRTATIPGLRCARARDVGSRSNNRAAAWLVDWWLPRSGEALADHPLIFHYVNVGPDVRPEEMITDVYLPLK